MPGGCCGGWRRSADGGRLTGFASGPKGVAGRAPARSRSGPPRAPSRRCAVAPNSTPGTCDRPGSREPHVERKDPTREAAGGRKSPVERKVPAVTRRPGARCVLQRKRGPGDRRRGRCRCVAAATSAGHSSRPAVPADSMPPWRAARARRRICDHRAMNDTSRPRPPSVERLLAAVRAQAGEREREAVVAAAREAVADERRGLAAGKEPRPLDVLAAAVLARLDAHAGGAVPTSVINATGVIVHTNLGRAPWPEAAIAAAAAAAGTPLLLELDRATGRRGSPLPRRRGAPRRADRRRGRPRHEQQRRRARRSPSGSPGAAVASPSRAASSSRSAAASGSRRSSGGPARAWSRSGRRTGRASPTSRRRSREGRAAMVLRVHPSNFSHGGVRRGARPGRAGRPRPRARRDRRRRPRQRRAAGRPRPFGLAHEPTPMRAPGRRRRPRHVQRRQARRRAAGRAGRRPSRPRRAAPQGPAGPGDAPGQGDARRRSPRRSGSTGPAGRRPRSRSGG